MKMVERMANALTVQLLKTDCGFEMTPYEANAMALAALRAMREPSEEMIDAGAMTIGSARARLIAAIDAAIKEAEAE
jgi:hypothetical protein